MDMCMCVDETDNKIFVICLLIWIEIWKTNNKQNE